MKGEGETFIFSFLSCKIERKLKGVKDLIQQTWKETSTIKKVKCIHTDAKKYMVNRVLTEGKTYEVKNETEEFLFVLDNSGKIGGFYKEYFEEVE